MFAIPFFYTVYSNHMATTFEDWHVFNPRSANYVIINIAYWSVCAKAIRSSVMISRGLLPTQRESIEAPMTKTLRRGLWLLQRLTSPLITACRLRASFEFLGNATALQGAITLQYCVRGGCHRHRAASSGDSLLAETVLLCSSGLLLLGYYRYDYCRTSPDAKIQVRGQDLFQAENR